jgi:hypothetical protein
MNTIAGETHNLITNDGSLAGGATSLSAGGQHAVLNGARHKDEGALAVQSANASIAMGSALQASATNSQATTASASLISAAPEASKSTVPPSTNASDVPECSQQGAQKKGKPFCYRCHTKGHTMSVCNVPLCCEICFGEHVTKACSNLKKMHNTAIPCGYAVEGLGFYFIPVAENPRINLEEKSAVVRVLEGSLTADQLAVELEKLLPGKNKWVIEERGADAYITNFSSSDLLDCVVNWGPMDTKTVKGKIRFEKGVENDVYKYEIDKVWVQFRGLPKEFREFPIIWAIGSILGVSRAVDMKFTKKYGRARLKVAVLDPTIIPNLVDIVICDYVYELQFRVEEGISDGEPQVIDMDSTIDEDDPKGEKKEDPMDEDGKREGLADGDAPKEQQPQPGKHNGAAQKEKGAGSGVLESKETGAQSAPAVVQANKKQYCFPSAS